MLAIRSPGLDVTAVARACRSEPLIFPRHLTVEVLRLPAAGLGRLGTTAFDHVHGRLTTSRLAVQAWASGTLQPGYGPGDAARSLRGVFEENGCQVVLAGAEPVLSCYLTPATIVLGFNQAADSLSDWPGGRIRLARRPEQVSRAEFKLEELFAISPVTPGRLDRCLDLGAAPGGWTRILRGLGPEVWAVDPARLAPGVEADPGVHYVRATAGEFLRSTKRTFDMVVNDMRMEPLMSSQTMLDAAAHVRKGGLAIVTLKIGTHKVLGLIGRCIKLLSREYDPVFIRQLHHNRLEVTAVLRRR